MKRTMLVALATLSLLAPPLGAQTVQQKVGGGEGKVSAEQLVEVEATIQSIDVASREIVLKLDKGEELAMVAGPDVKRLADLKVGDQVSIQYYESLTLALAKIEGAAPSQSASSSEMRAEPSELPGGIRTQQTKIAAKVTAVGTKASMVTLVGPKGRSVTLDVEPAIAAKVKVGDMVEAVYTEAVAVSVSRAKPN